jgi:hypothetical protein
VLSLGIAFQHGPHIVPRFGYVPLAGVLIVVAAKRAAPSPRFTILCAGNTASNHTLHDGEPFVLGDTGVDVVDKGVACLPVVELPLCINKKNAERAFEEAGLVDDIGTVAGKPRDIVHHHRIKNLVGCVAHHLLELIAAFHLAAGFGLIDVNADGHPSVLMAKLLNCLALPWDARIVSLAFAAGAAIPGDAQCFYHDFNLSFDRVFVAERGAV